MSIASLLHVRLLRDQAHSVATIRHASGRKLCRWREDTNLSITCRIRSCLLSIYIPLTTPDPRTEIVDSASLTPIFETKHTLCLLICFCAVQSTLGYMRSARLTQLSCIIRNLVVIVRQYFLTKRYKTHACVKKR